MASLSYCIHVGNFISRPVSRILTHEGFVAAKTTKLSGASIGLGYRLFLNLGPPFDGIVGRGVLHPETVLSFSDIAQGDPTCSTTSEICTGNQTSASLASRSAASGIGSFTQAEVQKRFHISGPSLLNPAGMHIFYRCF